MVSSCPASSVAEARTLNIKVLVEKHSVVERGFKWSDSKLKGFMAALIVVILSFKS